MSDTNKVAIFSNTEGDWQGLYIDGILVYEDHSIPARELLDHIKGLAITETEYIYDPCNQAGEYLAKWGGHCPRYWDEIEETVIER